MSKIEPEAWEQGTDRQAPGWGERDEGGKKGKGLVKEYVWVTMTSAQRQQGGEWLWEQQGAEEGQRAELGRAMEEIWANCNRTTIKKKNNLQKKILNTENASQTDGD